MMEQRNAVERKNVEKVAELRRQLSDVRVSLERALHAKSISDPEARIYRGLVEMSREPILVVDREGKFLFVSASMEEILGHRSDALIGTDAFDLLHPEDHEQARLVLTSLLENPGSTRTLEYRLRHRDGSWRCFESTVRNLLHFSPVGGIVAIAHDITRRKRAEEDLRRSKEQFRLLTEAMPQMVWSAGADGRTNYCNKRMLEQMGSSGRNESVSGYWTEIIAPEDKDDCIRKWNEAVSSEGPFQVECRCADKSTGESRWFLVRAVPVPEGSGGIIQWLGTATDIDEHKRAEGALRELNETLEQRVVEGTEIANRRAEQLRALTTELLLTEERERHSLATDLHDDLCQLLAAARMHLDMLSGPEVPEPLARSLSEIGKIIDRADKSARSLIFQLCPPALHDVGLVPALESLAEQMNQTHGLEVRIHEDGIPRPLKDQTRVVLFRAVRELLVNVTKHAGTRAAAVNVRTEGPHLIVRVEDHGRGFDCASALSRTPVGCFGLFSIQERLGHLGGEMRIESRPGQGTKVVLSVPLSGSGDPGV